MMKAIFARHIVDFGDYSLHAIEQKIIKRAYELHAEGKKDGFIELEDGTKLTEKTRQHLDLHEYKVTDLANGKVEIEWVSRDET